VLLRNYRIPIEQYEIEVPTGRLDKNGESLEAAARRELLEEAGYEAEELHPLKSFAPSPGATNNFGFPFIATGCKKVSHTHGDATEDISML
jgi:ADP-ribose pyrophosphatase